MFEFENSEIERMWEKIHPMTRHSNSSSVKNESVESLLITIS